MPLISIITPVYNGAKTLKRCIRSVRRQSMTDWEWIIVNDCSTDSTSAVLETTAKEDDRLQILTQRKNIGPYRCRQDAIEICRGEYVMFLDADDKLEKNALTNIAEAIDNKRADIYVTASKIKFTGIGFTHKFYQPGNDASFTHGSLSGWDAVINMLTQKGLTPNVWDKIYRKELIKKAKFSGSAFCVAEDLLFNLSAMPAAKNVESIDYYCYIWSSEGSRAKYYVANWDVYAKVIDHALSTISTQYKEHDLIKRELLEALAVNYVNSLQESCVQRILLRHNDDSIVLFINKALKHPVLKHLGAWNDISVNQLTPVDIMKFARTHLRNHRKYYTFTRVLNWLS